MLTNLLAQVDPGATVAITKMADEMAQKDFKWWFAIVFSILVASGTYVFKLQQKQISEQRQAHSDTLKQLLDYLTQDRVKTLQVLDRVGSVLEKFEQFIETSRKL